MAHLLATLASNRISGSKDISNQRSQQQQQQQQQQHHTTTTTMDNYRSRTNVTSLNKIHKDKWRREDGEEERFSRNFSRKVTFNFLLLASLFLFSSFFIVTVESCNESICASIVSKCTLLRSCDCDIEPTGCSCCKKCFACLDFLQVECCSCVGLCPMPNATLSAGAPQKSVVADFEEAVPQLWEALTDGEDLQGRWQKYTYPVDVKSSQPVKKEESLVESSSIQETVLKNEPSTMNCTVVFLSQCMAEKKCEISCRSMGASAYRWFTDGCCECVGHGCVSYGINESRCEMCSYDDDDDQLLPENISDEELERLEKLENAMSGVNDENSAPDVVEAEVTVSKKPVKKVTTTNNSSDD